MMDLCDCVNKTLANVFDMKLKNSTKMNQKVGLYNNDFLHNNKLKMNVINCEVINE